MNKITQIFVGLCAGISICGLLYLFGSAPISAQKNAAIQWQYCAVTKTYIADNSENQAVIKGGADICYIQTNGCQSEEIKSELIYSKFLQDFRLENVENSKGLAYNRARDLAFAKAVTKLGTEGWEMMTAPTLEFDTYIQNPQGTYAISQGAKDTKPDVYFKRIKN